MASRFLRRSKAKPPLSQSGEDGNRVMTGAARERSDMLSASTTTREEELARGKENDHVSQEKVDPAKAMSQAPRGPRSIPTAKSVQQEMPDKAEDLGLGIQTTTLLEPVDRLSSTIQGNRLRRKQSSADNRSLYTGSGFQSTSRERQQTRHQAASLPDESGNKRHETILGISIPTVSQSTAQLSRTNRTPTEFATSSSRMANFMSTQLPHKLSTQDLAPPTPGFATKSSSASTRCSTTSPGPFSRVSTPTSTSSCSPAIYLSAKRVKQTPSPARIYPPVTRRKGTENESHELSALEESKAGSPVPAALPGVPTSNIKEPGESSRITPGKLSAVPPVPPLRSSSRRLPRPTTASVVPTATVASKASAKMPLSREKQSADNAKASPKRHASFAHAFEYPRPPPPLPNAKQTSQLTTQAQGNKFDGPAAVNRQATEFQVKPMEDSKPQAKSAVKHPQPLGLRSPSTSTSSRIPTRSPLMNSNGVPAVKPPFRSATPSALQPSKPQEPKRPTKKASAERAESPKSTSRLNIFSRRTRQGSGDTANAELPPKKGPAAGTGHEGYGKYARRGRTSSVGTVSSRGRSTSDESGSEVSYPNRSSRKSSFASQSGSDLDDFYKERLEPVVIGGGGRIVENRNSTSGFSRIERGRTLNIASSSVEPLPAAKPQRTPIKLGLPVSPRDTDVMKRFPRREKTLEEVDANRVPGVDSPQPTLAARRSFNRSQTSGTIEPLRVPPPIDVSATQVSPSLGSFETILSPASRTGSSIFSDSLLEAPPKGSWSKTRRLLDRAKPSKSNFLRRAKSTLQKSGDSENEPGPQELFAAVSEVQNNRPVAHYCMLDDPDQEIERTLEDLLHEIEDDLELRRNHDVSVSKQNEGPQRQLSVLLPLPPKSSKDFPSTGPDAADKVFLRTEEKSLIEPLSRPGPTQKEKSESMSSPPRTPRLTQVGRIPKIVSKRDHTHKPPPRSFSRPFHREEYPSVANANLPANETILIDQNVYNLELESDFVLKDSNFVAEAALPLSPNKEFLSFSPRKRSALSSSTSSSGAIDFSAITAIRPDSTASLDEDEIWNEYDELFDRTVFPYTSLTGFSLATDPRSVLIPKPGPTNFDDAQEFSMRYDPGFSQPLSPKSTAMANQLPSAMPEFPSPPLRLDDAQKPIDGVESKQITRLDSTSSRKSHYSHLSKTNSQSSRSSRRSARPRTLSQLIERKRHRSDSSIHHVLRYHAVMISQYLSFSRVLFSPIHTEVATHISDRILVLDGLGNDDWSLYCALKYPEAVVYNLGTIRPFASQRRESAANTTLPNHRQIQHVGISHPFPFPKGFFAAVVWRFPAAGSEAAYYNAISEAKRVLRPGGYMELTVLDMDPVNMGNRARRAVRGFKVSRQAADADVSLAPAGDYIQKMLGRKGFENLNRCVVGIPVVGGFGGSAALECLETNGTEKTSDNYDFDFGNTTKDLSLLDDASMLQMVGRVGRWWWSQCFEQWDSRVEVDGQAQVDVPSIWDEPALLKECEERETSFKMLLCYAQKPAVARRRTVSV